jgi:hypothetical protein
MVAETIDNDHLFSAILIEYHKAGFKLVPLAEDAKTPIVKTTDIR